MKYILILTVALSFCYAPLFACGNEYYYNGEMELPEKNGFLDYGKFFPKKEDARHEIHSVVLSYWHPMHRNNIFGKQSSIYVDTQLGLLRDSLQTLLAGKGSKRAYTYKEIVNLAMTKNVDFKLLSDFGWKLAKDGNYKLAETLLSYLVKKHPKEYNINANLGTVFELLVKNELALFYIGKSIEIDPNSHYGSEWLHVNILKEKLGLTNDTWMHYSLIDYKKPSTEEYSSASIYPVDTFYRSPVNHTIWGKYHRDTLMKHIAYQLHERMFFIAKNDAQIAFLLKVFMFGMIQRGDYRYVTDVAKLAISYEVSSYKNEAIFYALQYCIDDKNK